MTISRRLFLTSTMATSMAGVASLGAIASLAPLAAGGIRPVSRGKTLVVIFLRGGADGLNLVVPFGDPHYAALRPSLAIGAPSSKGDGRAIDLDGTFGLHPALASMAPHMKSGLAIAAHAVGYDRNTRSHFEEQDTWETAVVGDTLRADGWLNRHIATSTGHGRVRAVSISNSLPRILHGDAPAIAIRSVDSLGFPGEADRADALRAALAAAYCTPMPAERAAARTGMEAPTREMLDSVSELERVRGVKASIEYPGTALGQKLREVARLIRADVGLEVAEVDLDGWDTHQYQGNYQSGGGGGQFANLARELSDAMNAFATDLADRMDDVLVMTMSDFGRTARENGTSGTDHGWANCMLMMGGPVKNASQGTANGASSLVRGTWTGLAPEQLHEQRDLLHSTDFRDVLGEVVANHLGNPNINAVLAGYTPKTLGWVGKKE